LQTGTVCCAGPDERLLDGAGYTVGRSVSVEQLIAESADGYDAALLASTHGWHEQTNDPWPWLGYFTEVLARAYQRFEQQIASDRSAGTKQDRVREYVLEHAPQILRSADVRVALPGISDPTIRLTLEQLKSEGRVKPEGRGRSAAWVKAPDPHGHE
jgi:Fic family protein